MVTLPTQFRNEGVRCEVFLGVKSSKLMNYTNYFTLHLPFPVPFIALYIERKHFCIGWLQPYLLSFLVPVKMFYCCSPKFTSSIIEMCCDDNIPIFDVLFRINNQQVTSEDAVPNH